MMSNLDRSRRVGHPSSSRRGRRARRSWRPMLRPSCRRTDWSGWRRHPWRTRRGRLSSRVSADTTWTRANVRPSDSASPRTAAPAPAQLGLLINFRTFTSPYNTEAFYTNNSRSVLSPVWPKWAFYPIAFFGESDYRLSNTLSIFWQLIAWLIVNFCSSNFKQCVTYKNPDKKKQILMSSIMMGRNACSWRPVFWAVAELSLFYMCVRAAEVRGTAYGGIGGRARVED